MKSEFIKFINITMFIVSKNYKCKHHCDHDVMLDRHTPYGCRHVVPSAVSLAGIYASSAKLALAGM